MRGLICFFALAILGVSAQAATYQFIGPQYTSVTNFTAPCSAGACANYAVGGRVTGQFAAAAPLAANLAGASVLAQVTSYSFSDGLHTVTNSDPGARLFEFAVSTDAGGNITNAIISIQRWHDNLAGPHGIDDRAHSLVTSSAGVVVWNNYRCGFISVNPSASADSCGGFSPDAATSNAVIGVGGAGGTWTTIADVRSVPTLSVWGLLALAGLIGLAGLWGRQRHV